MSRKLRIRALLGLMAVVAVVVGVLVWPEPDRAIAANQFVQLTTDWNNFGDNRDIHVTATLLDALGDPIEGPTALPINQDFTVWNDYLDDQGTTPTSVRFDWDYSNGPLEPDEDMTWLRGGADCRGTVTVPFVGTGTYCTVLREWD
jgi:hypothetical protein